MFEFNSDAAPRQKSWRENSEAFSNANEAQFVDFYQQTAERAGQPSFKKSATFINLGGKKNFDGILDFEMCQF